MISLGIETSCDDTAVGIVDSTGRILAQIKASQDRVHQIWGGVVPELASRAHLENILPVFDTALREAQITKDDVDIIACTYGPGLVGSLLVGLETAKAISFAWDKPLIGINHLRGHIAAVMLAQPEIELPSLGLLISGGHSEIIYVNPDFSLQMLAETRDDAAGETLDKFGRVLGLTYPAGPEIDRMCFIGNTNAVTYPNTRLKDNSLDFSFSGLKTAGVRAIERYPELPKEDMAASFMKAVVDQLLDRLMLAIEKTDAKSLFAVGGVASSSYFRERLGKLGSSIDLPVRIPPPSLCTDNGAMIAYCGFLYNQFGYRSNLNLQPQSRLPLEAF
jgi:N6-L-threonylcarbamoyladenine synthase